jgi:hypothetical protein
LKSKGKGYATFFALNIRVADPDLHGSALFKKLDPVPDLHMSEKLDLDPQSS